MQRQPGFPFAFACKRSGNCCAIPGGFVRVGAADVEAIAAHLGLDVAACKSRYLQADGETLKDGLGNRCVFLADGPRPTCSIYPVRPQRCRDWPFWPELLREPQRLQQALRVCPGLVLDAAPSA